MDTINKKYKVTAQILTPLHIGAGAEKDWVEGIDYLKQGDTLYHLDMQKMLAAGIDVNRMAQMFASGKTSEEIQRVVGGNLRCVSDFQMQMPCSSANPIKVFLRNQLTGNPIIAGSSLKGAIRSILFNYLRENERTNEEVFGKLKDGADFMRFIRIGDIEFSNDSTILVNSNIYNLRNSMGELQGGWKHGQNNTRYNRGITNFNTIYECLIPKSYAEGCILFSDKLFVHYDKFQPHKDKKSKLIQNDDIATQICKIINNHTFDYINKELDYLDAYQDAEYNQELFDNCNNLLGSINNLIGPNSHQCILKMSAGSGFHSITGDWQFEDYTITDIRNERGRNVSYGIDKNENETKTAKSRKVAFYQNQPYLMGFVKLTFEEVNE